MEAHAHGVFAGYRAIRQANLAQVGLKADYAKYREIIKEFMARKSLLLRYLHELLRWLLNIIGVPIALDVEGQGDLIYSDI